MRPVVIAGVGKTPFGLYKDSKSLAALAREAVTACLSDAGVEPEQVEALVVGNFAAPAFVGQNHLGAYLADELGLSGKPALRVEAACASGGLAFHQAWLAVAAGLVDQALVVGIEKMSSQSTERVAHILASAGDCCSEAAIGATFPSIFALIASRHMYQYGTTREQLAYVAVKNHENGAQNPFAQFRKRISVEDVLESRPVAEPLRLYDCSPVSDGAAAVLLAPADRAGDFRAKPVRVLGIGVATDRFRLADKVDVTSLPAIQLAAQAAYRMAGLGPREIHFAEVHDCFTIAELIALEELGFVAKGESGPFTEAGCTRANGVLPVNPSGGLKAKGHPVGATGVAQIADVALQIRGEAPGIQVARHEVGLAQNLGGTGATCVVTILGAV